VTWLEPCALGLTILAGAVAMRATGMGFALIASPFLALLFGPFEGVLIANVCGVASALLNLTQVHRQIDWPRARLLVPAGVLGVIPGALAARLLPPATLSIVVSALVLAGLAVTVLIRRVTLAASPATAAAGGLASGFMNATAGVGGPGLVVYALATKWSYVGFAATAQLIFAVQGIASITMKWSWPVLAPVDWVVLVCALAIGLLAGNALARKVSGRVAMTAVTIIAVVGALVGLAQGIARL
jgi:uncharacterized protein